MDRFERLQAQLNIQFRDASLLREAFTHSSYVNEHKDATHNERIEFLGDAVLQLAVSQHLYRLYPSWPEGKLTFVRAAIVREQALSKLAKTLSLGEYLLLGRGEDLSGGRERPSLLADVFEAFVGALYLDAGWDAVIKFLTAHMFPEIEAYVERGVIDAKSRLHEKVQQLALGAVEYVVREERGPANEREFIIEARIQGESYGAGSGRTKKEAEQEAAAEALQRFAAAGREPRR
ncbi:ribonuclease III [Paenibacillus antri]|uniref:Ribonuclease 3 n=1 Tax=Paenibacillus antri TaxID=2582848 RepID=A0A5R9G9X6_9BACL|nr:ribonuclease III [Paenibacillus antri]TLS49884.1 ribonuclease III [Paenibacillus antri]